MIGGRNNDVSYELYQSSNFSAQDQIIAAAAITTCCVQLPMEFTPILG